MLKRSLLSLMFLLAIPLQALAMPTINCHCFTDRSYDPARPAAADPYYLASTQNSFFAAVYPTDKKYLVRKKQKGTTMDDLWVAFWLAEKTGADPETLLQAKKDKGLWHEVLPSAGISAEQLGAPFAQALVNEGAASLDQWIVDEVLARFGLLDSGQRQELRQAGASTEEMILAALIERKTGQAAGQLCSDVRLGHRSWSGILDEARIVLPDLHSDIARLLSASAG